MTGICVIGLYIAYVIPIYLRLTNPDFQPGPWNLKGYHKIVGWTALAWIALITILFFAPVFWPFWPIWGNDNQITEFDGAGQLLLQAEQLQLHRSAHRLGVRRHVGLLALQRSQVVHWAEGARHQGRAAGDRAGVRTARLTATVHDLEMGLLRGMRPHLLLFRTARLRQSMGLAASASQPSNSGRLASRSQFPSLSLAYETKSVSSVLIAC